MIPDAVTLEAIDATAQLQATAQDGNGNPTTATLSWTSADTTVATVSAAGLVTAQGNGMTTVTVASGAVTQSVSVTVQQRLARLVSSADTVALDALGATSQLEVTAQDVNGHRMSVDVRWTSSEPSVATVDANGLVTAQGNGMTQVMVSSGSVTSSVSVTVQQRVSTIMVSRQAVTLQALGEQIQLNASAHDASGGMLSAEIRWDSTVPSVATVDPSGLVTARDNGMTTVTASSGSVSMRVAVTVQQRLFGLTVYADAVVLEAVDDTVQLVVTGHDANGHAMAAAVRWRSSDASVAIVDAGGLVTAKGHGTAEMTATSGAFSATVTVSVTLYPAITLTPGSSRLDALGATVQLRAHALDADGEEVPIVIQWDSSDPSIATVDATGLVTARRNGVATITASADRLSATAAVAVRQRVATFSVHPWDPPQEPLRLNSLGETVQISVDPRDANGHLVPNAPITARSGDQNVVTLDESLLLTAVGNGTTLISFRIGDFVPGFRVTVRQLPANLRIEPTTKTFRAVGETQQFTAHVTDANGYALQDEFILWKSGDRRIAEVDGSGRVSIRGVGETVITVTADDRSESAVVIGELEVTCNSGPSQPSIASVQSQPLVEGATVRIQGAGFCSHTSGNLVTVDSMIAEVASASATGLSFTVPQFHCLPSREVALAVSVGQNRTSRSMALHPDEPVVALAAGRQDILGAGQEKCLQFAAASQPEAYLIGIQSTRVPTDQSPRNALTPVRLVGSATATTALSAAAVNDRRRVWHSIPGPASAGLGELDTRPWIQAPADQPGRFVMSASPAFRTDFDLDTLPEVGDAVTSPYCEDVLFAHTIGAHALWLVNENLRAFVDDSHPGRIAQLSNTFDTEIYPTIVDYFGVPDLGSVSRVLIEICHERLAGAFASGNSIRVDLFVSPVTLAHELTHIVQDDHQEGFRFPDWFAEGQATLGEEIFGFAVSGRHSAQNYGRAVAFSSGYPNPLAWQETFVRLRTYLGGAFETRPQVCGWLDAADVPCGAYLEYSVGWSFLRWLTDQYARQYPGGDAQFHREMLLSSRDQLGALEHLLGEPIETLLAQWSAALYVDDRVAGADPALQFTSWNLLDIYRDDPNRLIPQEIRFEPLERSARIRDGSTWYVRVSGDARPATALSIENPHNTELPDEIQVWVVRLE